MSKKPQDSTSGLGKQITFSLIAVVLFSSILEIALMLADFNYSRFPREMKQNFIDSYIEWQEKFRTHQKFTPHPTRMWAAKPNFGKINSEGYQGKLLPIKNIQGVKRILFLGDSCTNAGKDHYPEKTIATLDDRYNVEAEPLIAGVGGYSTYQGYLYFLELMKYKPDIIVAYFNWNDHWLTYGEVDNKFKQLSQFDLFVHRLFSKLRIYQWLQYQIYPPKKYESPISPKSLEELLII
ncbi:MAG: hypothetical protein ACE5G9_05500 [Nitrospinales bacterium]